MSDSNDKRQEAFDRALETGGIPIDPYPGFLTWYLRASVEEGAGSALDTLCRAYPDREAAILDAWCRLCVRTGELWAWQEGRSRLDRLIVAGEHIPDPLADFAIVSEPRSTSGPEREGSVSVMKDVMARVLEDAGFEGAELAAQFGDAFPNPDKPDRIDYGSTLNYARRRGRGYVDPAFDPDGDRSGASEDDFRRPVQLQYNWSDPQEAARVLLTSGWPCLAVVRELWPGRSEDHISAWCGAAWAELPMWTEVRALLNHTVYSRSPIPEPLRNSLSIPRPDSRAQPRFAHRIRLAAVERALKERGRSQLQARRLCVAALGGSDLSHYTVQDDFRLGKERLGP